MPIRDQTVAKVRFRAPHPMVYDGVGVLEPGAVLTIEDCFRIFGDDWAPGFFFEPVVTATEQRSDSETATGGEP